MLTTSHKAKDARIFERQGRLLTERGFLVHILSALDPAGESTAAGVVIQGLGGNRSRWGRFFLNPPRLLREALKLDVDVYHFHDPEFLPWALLLQARSGRPVVYDMHENVGDVLLSRTWAHPLVLRLFSAVFNRIERMCMAKLAGVLTMNEVGADRARQATPRVSPFIGFPPEALAKEERLAIPDNFQVVYIGGIAETRGTALFRPVMEELNERLGTKCSLVLAGPLQDESARLLVDQAPFWLDYRGVLPFAEVQQLLRSANVGWIPLKRTPNHDKAWALKLGEYMAAGLPVVISDITYTAGIAQRSGCATVVPADDPIAHTEAIHDILTHPQMAAQMGQRGRDAVLHGMSAEQEVARLIRFYSSLLGEKAAVVDTCS